MLVIGTFLTVILITIVHAFLNGWLCMMAYELGVVPLINHLDTAPEIPYMYFVLIWLAYGVIKSKKVEDNGPKITEAKFWTRYIGIIITDFMILGILYIFNLCIC